MAIDRDRLLQLAADANKSTADISEALGLGAAHNFYYELNKDPELKEAFRAARMEANNGKPSRASARAPKTRLKKTRASKSALPALPPQLATNGATPIRDAIEHLRQRRDEIDGVIEQLEKIGA